MENKGKVETSGFGKSGNLELEYAQTHVYKRQKTAAQWAGFIQINDSNLIINHLKFVL